MAAIPYVLSAEPYYKAFHENLLAWGKAHPPVVAEQFVWLKADFRSRHAQHLTPRTTRMRLKISPSRCHLSSQTAGAVCTRHHHPAWAE